jgi:hypothetical protein
MEDWTYLLIHGRDTLHENYIDTRTRLLRQYYGKNWRGHEEEIDIFALRSNLITMDGIWNL